VGETNNLIVNTIRGGANIGNNYLEPAVQAVLRKKQQKLVRENRGVLEAIAKGANEAIVECKHQFRNRRWNCPTKSFWRGKNLFGKIVEKGKLALRCSRLCYVTNILECSKLFMMHISPCPRLRAQKLERMSIFFMILFYIFSII